jgi:photosystem II stability/assembly factor-like uncharacterized protein
MDTRLVGVAAVLGSLLLACDENPVTGSEDLGLPGCTTVAGTGAVTFTADEGASLAPTQGTLSGVVYTRGLAALSGSTLLAAHDGRLLRSTDAGCSWSQAATLPHRYVALVAASATQAYAYPDGTAGLFRVDVQGAVVALASPVSRVRGLAVWRGRPESVRVVGDSGQIFESGDGGATWRPVGTPLPAERLYSVAFDPADWDHAVAGTPNTGVWVTTNGGGTWQRAEMASTTAQRNHNVFRMAVSPVDPRVVWAAGIDLAEEDEASRSGRHIYLSRDGGRTFSAVLSESPGTGNPPRGGVTIINGPLLAPHPTDSDILYFVFSASFGNYGTDIIRFDAASGTHSVQHNPYHDVGEIAFAPGRPRVMYLGLGSEQRCEPNPCPGAAVDGPAP